MFTQKIKVLFNVFLIASAAVLISSPAMAKGKKSKVSAVVVHPTCLTTSDTDISINQSELDGIPGPVTVTSATSGEHWIQCPVNLPSAIHSGKGATHKLYVLGIEVCHSELNGTDDVNALATNPTSFSHIVETLVTKAESPFGSEPKALDETLYSSLSGDCIQSPIAIPFASSEGAVSIGLKLNFLNGGDADTINFGRIRVLVGAKRNLKISEPSEPSEPSDDIPSEPSEPSVSSNKP